jgi:hypothetical protein
MVMKQVTESLPPCTLQENAGEKKYFMSLGTEYKL